MAWHILVRVRRALSEKGFSKLAAADQLRLVLSECSVPLELPSALVHLGAVAKGRRASRIGSTGQTHSWECEVRLFIRRSARE